MQTIDENGRDYSFYDSLNEVLYGLEPYTAGNRFDVELSMAEVLEYRVADDPETARYVVSVQEPELKRDVSRIAGNVEDVILFVQDVRTLVDELEYDANEYGKIDRVFDREEDAHAYMEATYPAADMKHFIADVRDRADALLGFSEADAARFSEATDA